MKLHGPRRVTSLFKGGLIRLIPVYSHEVHRRILAVEERCQALLWCTSMQSHSSISSSTLMYRQVVKVDQQTDGYELQVSTRPIRHRGDTLGGMYLSFFYYHV